MEDILLVAPYNEIANIARNLKKTIKIPFSIIKGNLGESIDEVNLGIKNGVKIIVSRGGTAEYLRERIHVPVIEIPVTSFDILKAISSISSKGFKKIAFITTSNIIFKNHFFNKILDVNLQFETCNIIEIPKKVKYFIETEGIEAVIGDVNSTKEALKNGIYGELLESGEESLIQALNQAVNLLEINTKERVRIKEFEALLNIMDEGVLTIDKENKVNIYNESAEKIFGIPKSQVIGKDINESVPSNILECVLNKNKQQNDILVEVNNKKVVYSRIPIIINDKIQVTVAIFQEINNIEKLELNIRKKLNEKGLIAKSTFSDIIGQSKEMTRVKAQAIKFAKSEGTILIYGETGTGKELFAQSIHNESRRAKKPFVSVNCAALSEDLLVSELFGYEEGSFTGALKGGKKGLFEQAHSGTLFLDEIGEISLSFQCKLLRVLQEKVIRRIGGDKVIPIDVRILCATNKDLTEEVEKGNFREDLYYRINILELDLIPLRFRKDDIITMAIYFLKEVCIKEGRHLTWTSVDVFNCLLNYDWNGNARELRNFIERLVVCADNNKLEKNFVAEILSSAHKTKRIKNELTIQLSNNLKEMETEILKILIYRYSGDKNRLCNDLNISQTTLWRKLNFKNET